LPRETGRQNLGRIGDSRLSDQDIRGYRELEKRNPASFEGGVGRIRGYEPTGDPRLSDQDIRGYRELMDQLPSEMPEFAHGGYVGRGTMPGELHRRGSLPVRVAGESMGEYRKHREDEDDVRPVRRTLDNALSPTLSRRMFS